MNAVLQEFSPAFGSYPALKPLLAQQQVLPYPIECLPQILKQAVIEVQGYVQAPMSLVACNALAIASLVTQGLATIRRDTYLISPLSLFILSIADSGERKTFAESFFLNPIENLIAKQYQQMRPKLSQYEADLESWDAQKKGLKLKIQKVAKDSDENALQDAQKELQTLVDAKPKEPLIPKLKYSDVTIQAVTEGLRHYPSAGLLVSEGGIFFGGAGFQSDSAMTTLSILNDLWSGSALTIDRKGEGSIRLSDVALMMNIAVQSEVLRKFLTRTGQLARGSGFLARPLITMPESTQGFRPYKPPPELRALEQLISKFESLLLLQSSHLNDQGTLERITLELAPKARECWVAYYNEIEQAQQVGKYAEFIKAEASKSADNASRIAGIFHILEYGLTGTVSEQTMEQACRLARWHLDECRRFVFSSELPESLSAAQQLSQKIAAYLYQRFRKGEPHWNTITRREVQRECRVSGVQDIKSLQLVLDELQEADHILERKQEGKRHWLVMNPKLIMSHVKSNTKA